MKLILSVLVRINMFKCIGKLVEIHFTFVGAEEGFVACCAPEFLFFYAVEDDGITFS